MKTNHLSLLAGILAGVAVLLPPRLHANTAAFGPGWPASITVSDNPSQISFTNLPTAYATDATASYVSSSTPTNQTGFSFGASLGISPGGDMAGQNLILNFTPGTNTAPVTNTLTITLTNAPGTNGTSTNLAIIVTPPPPTPPYLEVRFYNSSTNAPENVYILPQSSSTDFGNGFWWSNPVTHTTNNWTNYIFTTTNMAVRLSDIGVTGSNSAGQPYYAIRTTNFPNAAWYLSYGGGPLAPKTNNMGTWDGVTFGGVGQNGARPNAATTNAPWFRTEWTPFELTLDGNTEDVGDTTYINEFSIPLTMRVLTNSYDNAAQGHYPSNSAAYYQIGGWTNGTNPTAVAATLATLASSLTNTFPLAVITNTAGVPVMVAGPSSAASGTLVAPMFTQPPYPSDAVNAFPRFTDYFNWARTNTNLTTTIQDYVGLAGGTNTYFFYYNFDLTITASNSVKLSGSVMVTNAPGSASYYTNVTGLEMEVGGDQGPNDNWASSFVYLAPTPANFTVKPNTHDLSSGAVSGIFTNLLAYSPYAAATNLSGTTVSIAGSHFDGVVQVGFSGPGNTLIPAMNFWTTNSTNLTAVVPYNAVTGPIVVTSGQGSGKSVAHFTVTGYSGAAQNPAVPPGGTNAPQITGFTPSSGPTAVAVLKTVGDWMALATNTHTGPTNTNPAPTDLFSSSFGTAVMGRILGDAAAGFAFGFLGSDTTNPATGTSYGASPSGSWWGGNQFPAGKSNSLVFNGVNSLFSAWGNSIHTATAVTYGHPIYDRMQFYSGTNTFQIQPSVATNAMPPIWVVELEFFNGLSSVAPPGWLSYNAWLTYYPTLTNTSPSLDPDGDTFNNGTEYAFGGNPTVGTPALTIMHSEGGIQFLGLDGAEANYLVQRTTNLATGPWTNYTATVTNAADQSNIPLPDFYHRREFAVPVTPGTNAFYRILFINP